MLIVSVAIVSFALGVLLAGLFAALVVAHLHREAAAMVDSATLMAGLGVGSAVLFRQDEAGSGRIAS